MWAIEVMKELGVPVACTMRVGPTGDLANVPPGDCAVRMAKAGRSKHFLALYFVGFLVLVGMVVGWGWGAI